MEHSGTYETAEALNRFFLLSNPGNLTNVAPRPERRLWHAPAHCSISEISVEYDAGGDEELRFRQGPVFWTP